MISNLFEPLVSRRVSCSSFANSLLAYKTFIGLVNPPVSFEEGDEQQTSVRCLGAQREGNNLLVHNQQPLQTQEVRELVHFLSRDIFI